MRSNYRVNATTQFKVLSCDQLGEIQSATMEVLERTGVNIFDKEALELFRKAGAKVDGNRVRIPSHLVEWALKCAPSRVVLCDRNGRRRLFLEGHNSYFGPGPTNNFTIDVFTGERRKVRKEDNRRTGILVDALPNIDFAMDLGTPSDVTPTLADIHAFEALLSNTTKPITAWGFDVSGYQTIIDMCVAVAGSLEDLRQNPFVCLYSEPSSPLQHSEEAISKLLFMAGQALPAVYTPCVMAGGTAPATMAGTLVIANCECMVGVVASQLKREGAPIIVGGVVTIMDMGSTVFSYGAPELSLLQAGLTELAHYNGLPVFGTAGCTDSKGLDQQSAIEGALSIMMAAESGANLIHDVGYSEYGSTGSQLQMVMANDIIGYVKRVIRGIGVDQDTLAVNVIEAVGPGGHFLAEPHTLAHFRTETTSLDLVDRRRYDDWKARGELSMGDRVRERARQILETHKPEPLERAARAKIDQIIQDAENRAGK